MQQPQTMRRAAAAGALAVALLAWGGWQWANRPAERSGTSQPKAESALSRETEPRRREPSPAAPAADGEAAPHLRTPGHLPPIGAPIAEPLASAPQGAPIALLKAGGTLDPTTGRAAAEVLWQALQRCGAKADAPIDAEFAMISGLEVGQSPLLELAVYGAGAEVAACLQKAKQDLRAPIISDTGGKVQVRFGPPQPL